MAEKKIVLITGCSDGGLGSALAIAFHKAGYRVIATARNLARLSETRELGIEGIQLDFLSADSIKKCVSALESLTGRRLDMLINNAGAGYNMPMVDANLDELRKLFELNTFSLVSTTRAFLPLLMNTKNAKIVNNISISAYSGFPVHGPYNASKAAANSINESMRIELAPFNIRVVALMTGTVRSKFFHNVGNDTSLPENSIYRVVPGGLTMMKDAANLVFRNAPSADVWAAQVVENLSRPKPPYQIWRGGSAAIVRLSSHLPIGMTDSQLTKLSKFDEVAEALKRG